MTLMSEKKDRKRSMAFGLPREKVREFIKSHNAKKVPEGFSYNSSENELWETVDSMREKIKQHVEEVVEAE